MKLRHCTICGAATKPANLRSHMAKVHPGADLPKDLPKPEEHATRRLRAGRKRREVYAYASFAIVVLALVVVGILWSGSSGPSPGTPAPAFSLRDTTGAVVSLEGLRGQFVLLDLMSTSCPVCQRTTTQTLVPLHTTQGQRVHFLSVDMNREGNSVAQGNQRIETFCAQYGATWQYALDTDGVRDKYAVYASGGGTPTTLLIDREGKILYRHVGFESLPELTETLDRFVSG